MRVLVVYYSWQGHTGRVAKALSDLLGAGLVRIEAISESGTMRKALGAVFGKKWPIKPCKTDLSDVDFLVVASPVWAGKVPPYVNEYISEISNGAGKPFAVLVEMGGSGGDKAVAFLKARLEKKGMRFVSSAWTKEADVDAGRFEDTLTRFAATIR